MGEILSFPVFRRQTKTRKKITVFFSHTAITVRRIFARIRGSRPFTIIYVFFFLLSFIIITIWPCVARARKTRNTTMPNAVIVVRVRQESLAGALSAARVRRTARVVFGVLRTHNNNYIAVRARKYYYCNCLIRFAVSFCVIRCRPRLHPRVSPPQRRAPTTGRRGAVYTSDIARTTADQTTCLLFVTRLCVFAARFPGVSANIITTEPRDEDPNARPSGPMAGPNQSESVSRRRPP